MNAMIYIRGNHADYDEWRDAYGAAGSGFDDVLPYFSEGRAQHPPRLALPRDRRSAARRGPDLRPRAEHGVRRGRCRRRAQAQRRLQRRRAGGRRALPGHVPEGPALVRRGRLHPPGSSAPQPHRPHRGLRDRASCWRATAPSASPTPAAASSLVARTDAEVVLSGGAINSPQLLMLPASAPAPTCATWASTSPSSRRASARTCRTIPRRASSATPGTRPTSPRCWAWATSLRWKATGKGPLSSNVGEAGGVLHLARRPRSSGHPAARRADRLLRQRHARAVRRALTTARHAGQRPELGPRQAALGRPDLAPRDRPGLLRRPAPTSRR